MFYFKNMIDFFKFALGMQTRGQLNNKTGVLGLVSTASGFFLAQKYIDPETRDLVWT